MSNPNHIPEWKLINSIVGLLIQADTNLSLAEWFILIKEPLPWYKSPEYEFLRFTANNWFNESVNILHSILFWYTKVGKEEFILPDDGNHDLKKIKDNSFLKIVRNNTTNHKSIKLEQPDWWLYNTINEIHIKTTRKIIEEVKIYLFTKYNYSCESITKDTILLWFNSILKSINLITK